MFFFLLFSTNLLGPSKPFALPIDFNEGTIWNKDDVIKSINDEYPDNFFEIIDIKINSTYVEIIYQQRNSDYADNEEIFLPQKIGQVYYHKQKIDKRSSYELHLSKKTKVRMPFFLIENNRKKLEELAKNSYGFISSSRLMTYMGDEDLPMEQQRNVRLYQLLMLELPLPFIGLEHDDGNIRDVNNLKFYIQHSTSLSPDHTEMLALINEAFQTSVLYEFFSIGISKKTKKTSSKTTLLKKIEK